METNGGPYNGILESHPTDYFRVVRERWWVILAVVVIAVGLATVFSLLQTPIYQATSYVLRQSAALDETLFGTSVFQFRDEQRQLQTGASLIKLKAVAQMVKDELQSPRGVNSLLHMITVTSSNETDVIHISANSPDPEESAKVANSFARQFIKYRLEADRSILSTADQQVVAELNTMTPAELASERGLTLTQKHEELGVLIAMQTGGFELVQEASVPDSSISPRPVRNAGLALVGGLVLGILLAFLLDHVDRRVKNEETMEREFAVPVLASVPQVGRQWSSRDDDRTQRVIGFSDGNSPFLEAFRTLRSSLRFYQLDQGTQVLLITSGLANEGKTVTAVNLGLSLALSGTRVILLEADLRRPMLDRYLNLDKRVGVSSVLAGTSTFADSLQTVRVPDFVPELAPDGLGSPKSAVMQRSLLCMTSGPLPPNPAELLSSQRMSELIKTAAGHADYVLIDTPPVLLVSDALNLANHANGVLIAAKMRATTLDEARDVRTVLERSGCRVLGLVVNGVNRKAGGYYRSHYSSYSANTKSA